jgi:hypothetical protein
MMIGESASRGGPISMGSRVRHLEKWVAFGQPINRLVFTSLLDNLVAADNKKA